MDPEHREMLHRKHVEYRATGDRALRDELIREYEGFASALAWRFGGRRDPEDLRQVALIALLQAVERFDPGHGTEFLSFAWSTIIGGLRRHRRDLTSPLRMSRSLRTRGVAVADAVDALTQSLRRSPTIPEIASSIGASVEEVLETLEASSATQMLSMDAVFSDTGALGALDDDGFREVEARELLGPLVAKLPERQQEILRLRFDEELSQATIAARLGISQMHVSRLLTRSLHQLRLWMSDEDGSPDASPTGNQLATA